MRKSSNEFDKNGYLTLFDNNTYLKDPLFWLQNLKSKISFNKVIDFLEELLLNNVRIEKDNNETIQFKEKGYKRDFKQLSDGYQSTIIWVCDLLSRLFDNQSDVTNFKDFKAIVLFDEIGAFLHPKWEYQFVSILRKYFKNIQWIFTTHCPIITLGASKDAVFYKLYKEDGITKVVKPFEKSLNMTANSLLTSPLWRLKFFTTPDIIPKNISSDDYIYHNIHKPISKYVQEVPDLTNKKVMKMIEDEFEKISKVPNFTEKKAIKTTDVKFNRKLIK